MDFFEMLFGKKKNTLTVRKNIFDLNSSEETRKTIDIFSRHFEEDYEKNETKDFAEDTDKYDDRYKEAQPFEFLKINGIKRHTG